MGGAGGDGSLPHKCQPQMSASSITCEAASLRPDWPAGLPPHKDCIYQPDFDGSSCNPKHKSIGCQPECGFWDIRQTQRVQKYEGKCTDFDYDDDFSNMMVGVATRIRSQKSSFHHLTCSMLHCHKVPKAFHGNTHICHIRDAYACGFIMCKKCAGRFSADQREFWDDECHHKHWDEYEKHWGNL
jgi:hypothetical protein